jgi:hypothetical protein
MAYTVTITKTVFGNKRAHGLKIVADAASATVETGLSQIDFFSVGIASMNSANIKLRPNAGAGSTAAAGYLGVSGCTSGDEFYVTVYGR